MFDLNALSRIRDAETRSATAENPTGAVGGGARAEVGDDQHTTPAASELGRGWKVRPCLRLAPGESATLAEVEGPGVVRHIWITVGPTTGSTGRRSSARSATSSPTAPTAGRGSPVCPSRSTPQAE